jgi:hypothetical protein
MPGPVFNVGSLTYIADLNALSAALFSYSVQTVNFTAVRGFIYGLDTDALQITLPLAPAAGDRLMIMPTKAAVLKCTLLRNGQLINDAAADQTIVVPQPMLLTFDAHARLGICRRRLGQLRPAVGELLGALRRRL